MNFTEKSVLSCCHDPEISRDISATYVKVFRDFPSSPKLCRKVMPCTESSPRGISPGQKVCGSFGLVAKGL